MAPEERRAALLADPVSRVLLEDPEYREQFIAADAEHRERRSGTGCPSS